MRVRSIRPDEYEACLDLWAKAFGNTRRDYFKRYFWGDPWFKPEYTRVCEVDGSIVSVVQIVRRDIRVGSCTLAMGGIANVATLPECRGKGYSSVTIQDAVEVMMDEGMDVSMLLTGINGFYERLGWSTVHLAQGAAAIRCHVKDPETRYAVRSYRDDDAAQLVAVHNEFNASRSFSVVRTPDYWTGFANSPEAETYEPCIAVYQDRVAGYALGQPCGDSYGLAEMACLKGHEACLRNLAHRIWSRATSRGAKQLLYRLPSVPEVEQAIVDIAIPAPARPYTHIMLRILNLRSVFEKILPELELRSLAERGRGQVTLSTTNGCVTLDVSPGHVELSDQPASSALQLTQPQLLDLLFGLKEPREILPETSGSVILAKLFPKQDAMFYVPDAF